MGTLDTLLNYPETSNGYVLDGGSTFYLKNLPNEIGTFLALTGYTLQGNDLRYSFLDNNITLNYIKDFLITLTTW